MRPGYVFLILPFTDARQTVCAWVMSNIDSSCDALSLSLQTNYTREKVAPVEKIQQRATLYIPRFLSPSTATTISDKDGRSRSKTSVGFAQRVCAASTSHSSSLSSYRYHVDPLPVSSNQAPTPISSSLAVATRTRSTRSSSATAPSSSPVRSNLADK